MHRFLLAAVVIKWAKALRPAWLSLAAKGDGACNGDGGNKAG
jgi:hypothetical protein